MADNTYDAIVVGSGISGGWAAKELTEKGLKTLLLERGRNIEHIKDYVNANKAPWEFEHRGNRTQQMIENYPVLKRDYVLNETNLNYWASDKDSPYIEKQPFDWFRSYQVGGRSLVWGRQSYRWHNSDFEANAKDGIAVDWPIRYADLAPWYSYVEKFAGISGNRDGVPILPDGDFMPPMEMNVVEKDVAKRLKEHYKGNRHMIIGRTANITQPHEGRVNCQYRNKCWLGCPYGAYFSTQSATLPAAIKTGNLTLRPWSIVVKVIYDKDTKLAKGVEVLDAETNKTYEYFAKIIFLNASTINTAAILMNSATDVWPEGLGSSGGALGHNIMDHHLNVGASGTVDGYEDKYYYGRRANGIYVPRYRNLNGEKRDYIRGFGYQGGAGRERWSRNIPEMNIGADFKEALTEPGAWTMGIGGFGETLPYHENRMWLDKTKKDKWGMPVPVIDAVVRDNEKKMRIDMMNDAAEMLEAAGVTNINKYQNEAVLGKGIHEMGTARMGRDPKTSVLNGFNQVWDAKNVYVTDGAAMTSSACQNPSLTYMALTARAANHAVSELKKMNI
ncbi:GMC family oxidoreductase [Mucilaginibacter sp. CSA2-8R]|uniref:GMC family oxidoreductase n=1 Tax=Mucilaginibacter sp. CSA2-8R TaxID=3141542 RepID=UPI00315CF39C